MGPNPALIQDYSGPQPSPPPLFLIHDASGMVATYYKLGSLGRKVYGLWDPKFDQDGIGGWQSIQHIAEAYARLIRRVTVSGEIILGGWSFGGLIAVQLAHLLATSGRRLCVAKVILIDAVYPGVDLPEAEKGQADEQHVPVLPGVSEETRQKLLTALMRATNIADQWVAPEWASRSPTNELGSGAGAEAGLPVPPQQVVLVRAEDMVPLAVGGGAICPLDRTRFLPKLGWEHMQPDFVTQVIHTSGNHYSVFDTGINVTNLTKNLKDALAM